ncbi:hypothetical protein A2165_03615 [Candidatus Curtissbacteria bacterium RBG_13_40_7]|uniref:N-acetyltransferase domain-containing protein n=1 Tax=Candidatus Curtissbacteria bacterium RBG_13_40_7 TaxID=1797706 RepID=A0A1F5FX89_9BACT|nr:MAG: hypothetical protein A2165_03615 [Candidatus Curtissbacteria bacterium RBG_13_40_7]
MQIRKVLPRDKKELSKLLHTFHNFTQKNLSKKQANFRDFKNAKTSCEELAQKYIFNSNYLIYIAEENSHLKGLITGKIKEKKERIYDKAGYIEKWFVKEEHQNQGIGKKLFDELIKDFKQANCTHLELDAHIENEKALKIYERLGFTKRLITLFKVI